MSDTPLTSVIMVSFFTGPILDKAIASVLAQTAPVELILVDNGNPPEVSEKLAERAKTEPRLKIISGHGNVGFAVACNKGAAAAQGLFLLFLNPDCVLSSQTIAKLLVEAKPLKRPFMIGPRIQDEHGFDQRGCRRAILTPIAAFVESFFLGRFFPQHRLNQHKMPMPEKTEPVPAISGAFMFLLASDFKHVKGFDEGYFLHVEDLDFCLRFRRAKGEIYFAPNVVVRHIGGTSEATSLFIEKQKAIGFSRYFHENFSHSYPQPVLWALDAAIWTRYGIKCLIPRINMWRSQLDKQKLASLAATASLFKAKKKAAPRDPPSA